MDASNALIRRVRYASFSGWVSLSKSSWDMSLNGSIEQSSPWQVPRKIGPWSKDQSGGNDLLAVKTPNRARLILPLISAATANASNDPCLLGKCHVGAGRDADRQRALTVFAFGSVVEPALLNLQGRWRGAFETVLVGRMSCEPSVNLRVERWQRSISRGLHQPSNCGSQPFVLAQLIFDCAPSDRAHRKQRLLAGHYGPERINARLLRS